MAVQKKRREKEEKKERKKVCEGRGKDKKCGLFDLHFITHQKCRFKMNSY